VHSCGECASLFERIFKRGNGQIIIDRRGRRGEEIEQTEV
jgi:hypothetical protein